MFCGYRAWFEIVMRAAAYYYLRMRISINYICNYEYHLSIQSSKYGISSARTELWGSKMKMHKSHKGSQDQKLFIKTFQCQTLILVYLYQ